MLFEELFFKLLGNCLIQKYWICSMSKKKLNEINLDEEEIAIVSTVIEDEFDIILPIEFLDNVRTLYDIIGFVQRAICSSR